MVGRSAGPAPRLPQHALHSPEGFLASRARYLVIHTDVLAEEEKVEGTAGR